MGNDISVRIFKTPAREQVLFEINGRKSATFSVQDYEDVCIGALSAMGLTGSFAVEADDNYGDDNDVVTINDLYEVTFLSGEVIQIANPDYLGEGNEQFWQGFLRQTSLPNFGTGVYEVYSVTGGEIAKYGDDEYVGLKLCFLHGESTPLLGDCRQAKVVSISGDYVFTDGGAHPVGSTELEVGDLITTNNGLITSVVNLKAQMRATIKEIDWKVKNLLQQKAALEAKL